MKMQGIVGQVDVGLSIEEIKKQYGKTLSYNDVVGMLSRFTLSQQEDLMESIDTEQKKFWDEMVSYYAKDHPKLPPVPDHFKAVLKTINPQKGQVIVDLGCGVGALIRRILEEEPNVERIIGIDYASGMVNQCREELGIHVRNGRVLLINHDLTRGIPLKDGGVDTCVSNWGISYFSKESLQRVIYEICRVLKPNGYFVCAAVVKDAKLDQLKRIFSLPELLMKWELIQKATQFSKNLEKYFPAYSVEELRSAIERGGLIVEGFYATLYGGSVTLVAHKAS